MHTPCHDARLKCLGIVHGCVYCLGETGFAGKKRTKYWSRIISSSSLRCARAMFVESKNLQVGVRCTEVIEDLVLDILWERSGGPCFGVELRQ